MKEQKLLTYLRKAVQEYSLIKSGDRILVGVSGGKDSLVLLYGLKKLQAFLPEKFELAAVIIDLGLNMDYSPIEAFCETLHIPLYLEKTGIFRIASLKSENAGSPCSLCANMRRAALTQKCVSEGFNVLALGHHKDDYLTTLLMSVIYEGQFYTFAPKTGYENRDIRIIRPMLYVPEAAIKNFSDERNFPVVKNLCPSDKTTKREEMKGLLEEMQLRYPGLKEHLLHSVIYSDIPDWVEARKPDIF